MQIDEPNFAEIKLREMFKDLEDEAESSNYNYLQYFLNI